MSKSYMNTEEIKKQIGDIKLQMKKIEELLGGDELDLEELFKKENVLHKK